MQEDTQKKKKHVLKRVLLDAAEMKAVKERMEFCHEENFSMYCKNMMLNGFIVIIDDSAELKRLNLSINEISTNINQITHAAIKSSTVSEDSIKALLDSLEKVWQSQRSLNSGNQF
ncbi:MAG: plasmid mobilization relaxosome protein MobC [Lachnospiraceae bacterium]|nr:plasmid mobilization relaxosome protein MobC [Lachnospiraceae bacterium]